jgi:putative Mg2+ transporter-C (MgtC) family protein
MDIFFTGGHEMYLPFGAVAWRLALAALLGGLIGFEREWRKQPAGLRTHILVCLSAALIAILTIEIVKMEAFTGSGFQYDPIRLVEAVTAGVAFLAAGLIVFARGEIHGLTTGAGMWLAAAVGLSAGLGFWQIALLATALAVLVLGVLQQVERRFGFDRENKRVVKDSESVSADQG